METKDDLTDVLEYFMSNRTIFDRDILDLIDTKMSEKTRIILLPQQTKMLEDLLPMLPIDLKMTKETITNVLKQGYYAVEEKDQLNELRTMYGTLTKK
jgi:hypothetical protein|tara:strand:+ start:218 stop:511 length:294 start_codon:yes stop_codon:yes gene_type:complete